MPQDTKHSCPLVAVTSLQDPVPSGGETQSYLVSVVFVVFPPQESSLCFRQTKLFLTADLVHLSYLRQQELWNLLEFIWDEVTGKMNVITQTIWCVHSDTHCPQQLLVRDHQSHQLSPAHCIFHFLQLSGSFLLVAMAAGKQIGSHHQGDIPQRHPIVVLVWDHLTQEKQQSLWPWKQTVWAI